MDAETRQEIDELHRRIDSLVQAVQACASAIALQAALEPAPAPVNAVGELVDQASSVGCPTCGARAGECCTDTRGRSAGLMAHRARAQVWKASRARS